MLRLVNGEEAFKHVVDQSATYYEFHPSTNYLREPTIGSHPVNFSDTQENDKRKLCAVLGTLYGTDLFRSMLVFVD